MTSCQWKRLTVSCPFSSCVQVEEHHAVDIDVYHCPNCDVERGPSLSEYILPHIQAHSNQTSSFSPAALPPTDCRTGPVGGGSLSAQLHFSFLANGGMGHLQKAQRADINRLIEWCYKPSTLIGQPPPSPAQLAPHPLQLHLPPRHTGGDPGGFAEKRL